MREIQGTFVALKPGHFLYEVDSFLFTPPKSACKLTFWNILDNIYEFLVSDFPFIYAILENEWDGGKEKLGVYPCQ